MSFRDGSEHNVGASGRTKEMPTTSPSKLSATSPSKNKRFFNFITSPASGQGYSARQQLDKETEEDKPPWARSASTPYDMDSMNQRDLVAFNDTSHSDKKTSWRKKHLSFRKLFRKGDRSQAAEDAEQEETARNEEIRRQTELAFAHTLMKSPEELCVDLCRTDSEPDLVQTICSPNCFSKDVIRLDKKLYQIDVANNRLSTLRNLSGTAAMAKDFQALEFLQHTLLRIRKQRTTLFRHADKYLTEFKRDPSKMLSQSIKRQTSIELDQTAEEAGGKVTFIVQSDEDEDSELRWEINSLNLSTDTSEESEEDGPTVEELQHLAREIRKTEGTRFKRKQMRRKHTTDTEQMPPPPPNPLAHSGRVLMRSHVTIPGGMVFQTRSSSTSLDSQANTGKPKDNLAPNLPFNLLSLAGQLSWMISEYIEHDSSTYKWATELINFISRMSVTKTTWLNLHQQLRETTELLYNHRNSNQHPTASTTAKGEIAWQHLQMVHGSLVSSESTTVTAGTRKELLTSAITKRDRKLPQLSALLEKKFHLAYVCDLILWRAHKILFLNQPEASDDIARYQLIDFRIRHMQLRLDQANSINWPPELINWIMCWIDNAMQAKTQVQLATDDHFCLNELKSLKTSIEQFRILVDHIKASEFISEDYLSLDSNNPNGAGDGVEPHRRRHFHPYHLHHGQGGHQQDLRPLDADRCSHAYSNLIRQVHDSAMARRPLGYFAERALYDVALELACPIDWHERLTNLLTELVEAHSEWEHLLHSRLGREFYEELFEPPAASSLKTERHVVADGKNVNKHTKF